MDDVEAHIAGAGHAHDGVGVGAVVVQQAAGGVDDGRHLADVAFEQSQRAGVGQHKGGRVRPDGSAQRVQVDCPVGVGLDLDDLQAAHRRGGGVGAMGRVGDDNLGAVLAAVAVVGADELDAGEFAVGAGRRLHRHGVHAGDLRQVPLHGGEDLERPLRRRLVLQGMDGGKTVVAAGILVNFRVVFHRA